MSPWQHTPCQHTDLIGTINFRLLVPSRNKKNQADQSNSPYLVTFQYSLHLIGQFESFFRNGTSNLKLTVAGNGTQHQHTSHMYTQSPSPFTSHFGVCHSTAPPLLPFVFATRLPPHHAVQNPLLLQLLHCFNWYTVWNTISLPACCSGGMYFTTTTTTRQHRSVHEVHIQ